MLLSEDWRPFIFGAFFFLEIYGTPGVSIFIGQSGGYIILGGIFT
jgi:hypothetical protein